METHKPTPTLHGSDIDSKNDGTSIVTIHRYDESGNPSNSVRYTAEELVAQAPASTFLSTVAIALGLLLEV